ncbi:MAG: ATP-binding cassette domain-containing protein, partial [Lachnospiraceae bacterium]
DYKVLSFTVKENIAFGDASAADDRNIFHILDSLNMGAKIRSLAKGLDTYLNNDFEEDGVQMSGGEIQKLAIARAIYRNAPIFIMDEPTSALDAISEMEIYELVYKMTENRTCIFISHRMSTARLADKIAFFDHGCITEYGTYEELDADKGSFTICFICRRNIT